MNKWLKVFYLIFFFIFPAGTHFWFVFFMAVIRPDFPATNTLRKLLYWITILLNRIWKEEEKCLEKMTAEECANQTDFSSLLSSKIYRNGIDSNDVSGTSSFRVFATIVPIFYTTLFGVIFIYYMKNTSYATRFLFEYFVIVCSIIYNVTIFNGYIYEISTSLLFISICLITITLCKLNKNKKGENFNVPVHPGYLTLVKAAINLITAVCILAVDFSAFPRNLSKTQKYGFGLMDTGIGLFVFSAGVVTRKPEKGKFKSRKALFDLFISTLPFIVLGVGRTVVLKLINYGESVSEYGLHWNAFWTLGIARLFGTLLASVVQRTKSLNHLALLLITVHQIVLRNGLADFVMDPTVRRSNFIYANREGLTSTAGHVAIYLSSMWFGSLLEIKQEHKDFKDFLHKTYKIGALSLVFWIILETVNLYFSVSRRIADLGYFVWTLSIAFSMTFLFMTLEIFVQFLNFPKSKNRNWSYVPVIMQAINFNGLFFFLLANVLTGLVNIILEKFNARYQNTTNSVLILMLYMLVACLISQVLYNKKIRLKYW